MIPRILVPEGARLPEAEVTASTRRRPSSLDERTLVPSTLPLVTLDGRTTIPSNLPLDSIAARVVVPRDINVEAVQKEDESTLPLQPTDMDERITVPQGAAPPAEVSAPLHLPVDLVEPDVFQTGEVSFLPPERLGAPTIHDKITRVASVLAHVAVVLFLIFEPKIFGPHVRSNEEEDIARKQITVLLPPGALDALKPAPGPPVPHESVRVDPKVIKKVAPTPLPPVPAPTPTPQPEQPKRDLPSAPVPQPNAVAPTPQAAPQGTRADLPKTPLKLETPDMPVPQNGLILPKQGASPGDVIRDAQRATRPNSPRAIGGGGQLPPGVGGGGGGNGRGSAGAGLQMLTDDEGVDFRDYLQRVYITVKQNWFAVMPASVSLGDQGVVSLQFKIMRDGSVPNGDPAQIFSSGKEPLDRAAHSSIRASSPFQPLPSAFKGPYIELRFTYYYNLEPPRN